eukprot:TRINITY_DN42190_c0_g1_i1.p1 TRINITY_DN42190_c0_g1~~TRINITY_DN42190_c0_g1_i1.p1  ORF type:complete len:403 (+),score=55.40 TRINITY_DN42190_c0_g1_i1:46-1254(+)
MTAELVPSALAGIDLCTVDSGPLRKRVAGPCEIGGLFAEHEFAFAVGPAAGVHAMRRIALASRRHNVGVGSRLLNDLAARLPRTVFLIAGAPEPLPPFAFTPERCDAGRWEEIAQMSFARSNCMAAAVAGRIYVVGGWGPGGILADGDEVFDPVWGRWSPLRPAMPTRRVRGCATAAGSRLYVIGGLQGCCVDKVECFDPCGSSTTAKVERGDGSSGFDDTSEVGDAGISVQGHWQEFPPLPGPRSDHAAVATGGKIYSLGGVSSSGNCLKIVSCFDLKALSWEPSVAMAFGRATFAAAALRRRIYIFGGLRVRSQHPLEDVNMLDLEAGIWIPLPAMPIPRTLANAAAVVVGDAIFLFGGREPSGEASDVVERFDTESRLWDRMLPMPHPRRAVAAVATWR